MQLGAATRSRQAGHSRTLTWGRRTPPRALSDGKCKSGHGAAAGMGPDSVWRRTGGRKELLHLVSVALVPRPDAEGGGGQMALGVPTRLPREPHCSCEEIAATRVHANDDAVVIHAQASGPCMAAQRSGRNGVAGSCVPHQPYPIQSHTCRQLRLTACNSTCRAAGRTEAFLEALLCHRSRHETDVVGGRAWQRPGLGNMMHRAWAQHSAVVASSMVLLHAASWKDEPTCKALGAVHLFLLSAAAGPGELAGARPRRGGDCTG